MYSSASAIVLCIFQLPAISGVRSCHREPPLRGASCPRSAPARRRRPSRGGQPCRRGRTAASAAALSPPPTTVVPGASATASATACVPAANGSSSNAPIGPFQNTRAGARDLLARRPARCAARCRGPSSRRARRRRRAAASRCPPRTRAPSTRSSGSSSRQPLSCAAASARVAGSMPSSSHSEAPTVWPWALKNGKHIAPPMRIVCARSRNASMTPILSVTFAPPTIATSGAAGASRMPFSVSTSRCSSSPAALGSSSRHADRGRVRAVRGAERVVDVGVGQRRVAPGELRVVLRLAGLVADVLEHHEIAVRHVVQRSAPACTSAPSSSPGGRRPARSDSSGSRSFGRPRCAASTQPRAVRAQPLDRRQRGPDARVVGDAIAVQGDIEVHPDEDALALDVEVVQRAHYRSFWTRSTQRFE